MDLKDALKAAAKGPSPLAERVKPYVSNKPPLKRPRESMLDEQGRFRKGNPGGGRLGHAEAFARRILEYTGNGEELILFYLGIVRGELLVEEEHMGPDGEVRTVITAPTHDHRLQAAKALTDRALGKALERIAIGPDKPEELAGGIMALSTEDARTLYALTRKLAHDLPAGQQTVDAAPVERQADPVRGEVAPEPTAAGEEPAPPGRAGPQPG